MIQAERNEEIRLCRKLISECEINTHTQFSMDFNLKYNQRVLSRSAIYRLFKKANVVFDKEQGKYVCLPMDDDLTKYQLECPLLHNFLLNNSDGVYVHEKGVKSIWLSVEHGKEEQLAELLYDYCDKKISLVIGYGCVNFKCHNLYTQNKVELFLKKNFSWHLDGSNYNERE